MKSAPGVFLLMTTRCLSEWVRQPTMRCVWSSSLITRGCICGCVAMMSLFGCSVEIHQRQHALGWELKARPEAAIIKKSIQQRLRETPVRKRRCTDALYIRMFRMIRILGSGGRSHSNAPLEIMKYDFPYGTGADVSLHNYIWSQ